MQQQEKNLRILTSVLEIKFCGQQGLALREHRFEDGANPRNICALIDFRAQTDNMLSNHLERSIVPEMLDTFLLEIRMN